MSTLNHHEEMEAEFERGFDRAANQMTTRQQVMDAFWLTFHVEGKPRELYGIEPANWPAEHKAGFNNFLEHLSRSMTIPRHLAATLKL